MSDDEDSYEWVHWGDGLEKFTIDNAPLEDVLLDLASTSNTAEMDNLLQDPEAVTMALKTRQRPHSIGGVVVSKFNLCLLVETASAAGQAEMVHILLLFGNSNDVKYSSLITNEAINLAMKGRHLDVLKTFHIFDPKFVDRSMSHGMTPLCQAISRGINQGLIETGAGKFNNLYTPIIQWLLESGADANLHPFPSGSCLNSAAAQSSIEIVALLLKHGARIAESWALHTAARTGRVDVMNLLYEHGASVDEVYLGNSNLLNQAGETPVHVAARYRQEDATSWLLDHGASTEIEDWKGRTVLEIISDMPEKVLVEEIKMPKALSTAEEKKCLTDVHYDDRYWARPSLVAARKAARSQR